MFFLILAVMLASSPIFAIDTYYEQDGGVIVEIESAEITSSDWKLETNHADYTGAGYIRWDGGDYFSGAPGCCALEYKFHITNAGSYKFRYRNYHTNSDKTLENDAYVKLDDGEYLKVWNQSVNEWSWSVKVGDNCCPFAEFDVELTAGDHTLTIKPRSKGFAMDRWCFYSGDFNYADLGKVSPTTDPSSTILKDRNIWTPAAHIQSQGEIEGIYTMNGSKIGNGKNLTKQMSPSSIVLVRHTNGSVRSVFAKAVALFR